MKIALIGYGKMGHIIEEVACERGHEIVCIIDKDNLQDFDSEAFASADVAIEFTTPTTAEANVRRAWDKGKPVVCGTTGWDVGSLCDEELKKKNAALVWSSNYSIGVNILFALNQRLAELITPDYTPSIVETHHIHKLDAPSGTAITLAEDICQAIDRKTEWKKGTTTWDDGRVEGQTDHDENQLLINSIRHEEVPGIHSICYDSEADQITITHSAHSRKGFALGAVLAAEYTHNHSGLLTTSDLFNF